MIPGIVVYLEDLELFDETLDDAEIGHIVRQLAGYVKTGREAENLSPVGKIAYKMMRIKVDREIESYNKKVAGINQRWQRQKQPKNKNEIDSNSIKNSLIQKEKEKENEKETETENESEQGFNPPTLDQIRECITERKLTVDPVAFERYYRARGWMMGKSRMVDYKAALESWQMKEGTIKSGKPDLRVLSSDFAGQRDLTEDQMKGTSDDDIMAAIMEQRKKVSG